VNRQRWLILIFGPLPIIGSSWAISAWFRSGEVAIAARNTAFADAPAPPHASARRASATTADDELARACRQTADRLAKQLGAECHVIVRAPFVMAGDMRETELETWHSDSILPAVRAMQNRYFKTRPDRPVTLLLFTGEESYNSYARELFGDSAISVYGYYKPNVRTVVANTGTGGGTLIHELTHALIDFDIPDVPDWFNEGLASLHEQCRFRSDERGPWIEGLVNWRLPGLQSVIREGRLRPLTTLIESDDFRGPLMGTNYAQARYFCLYMQHKGVLEEFVRHFREQRDRDGRGTSSVAHVFGQDALARLDRDFQRWVLELSR
jgi:hypothetical protein